MISVIIPTLNEGINLPRLLADFQPEETAHEIIVVDGGSRDDTVRKAREYDVGVVRAESNRGAQLRRGSEVATGEILLFLHADCRFPRGGLARIEAVLSASPRVVGGNFRLVFDGDSAFSRWLTGFYAWFRGRGLYYGDSGVFVRREVYDAIGGVRPIALMEDFDFTRRLERFGPTCCIEDPPLVTSSRRFEGRHPIRIFWGWLKIHALYYLSVPPERLARIYDGDRSSDVPAAATRAKRAP
ncbi:MAG: TIGR04283 family arsenosugar biosynthesis glycosyltransferase [Proteobacteria bacterium]|nr:TIGR04283 family arsenosugar biosynthesis glycosyltransferase [Pseudomonadota bacterium]